MMQLQKRLWTPVLIPAALWLVSNVVMSQLVHHPNEDLEIMLATAFGLIITTLHALFAFFFVKLTRYGWMIHVVFFCAWAYPLSSSLIWTWRYILIALYGHY